MNKRKILSILLSLALSSSMIAIPASAEEYTDTDAAQYEAAAEESPVEEVPAEKAPAEITEEVSEEAAGETAADRDFGISLFSMNDNLSYTLSGNTLTISGTGDMTFSGSGYNSAPWYSDRTNIYEVIIDEGVTSIANNAFYSHTKLTKVTLPSSLTKIGAEAFSGCEALTSVSIPDSVTEIGSEAFRTCSALPSIVIPDNVTSIGSEAFLGCTNLRSVTISSESKLTSIGYEAFCNCSYVTSIEIPAGVTTIDDGAFYKCTRLASVTIPSDINLTSIGIGVFRECSALKSIIIPDSVTSVGDRAFYGCSALETAQMSKNIRSIGASAFYDCEKLKAIELPEGLNSIGEQAFRNCDALESVKIPGTVETIGEKAFYDCDGLIFVVLDEGIRSINAETFSSCGEMTSITLPATLETVGQSTFSYCSKLATVYYAGSSLQWNSININTANNGYLTNAAIRYNTIRDGDLRCYFIGSGKDILKVDCLTNAANTISAEALKDNTQIRAVFIPARVRAIGDNAFSGCTNIEKVYYTESESDWTSLKESIGEGNDLLTGAVLFADAQQNGDNVIYRYADADNTNLVVSGSGIMPDYSDTKSSDYSPWRRNTTITSVTFEDNLTSVGAYAFVKCTALKSVTLSDKIASIGANAFNGCSAMTEITIPASVTEIKESAFTSCSALNEIYFTGTKAQWKELTDSAASGNDALTANGVTVHYEVKNLDGFKWWIAEGGILEISGSGKIPAFTDDDPSPWKDNTDITAVIIPSTVKSIGDNAFSGCENLKKVYYTADGVSWSGINKGDGNSAITSAKVYYNAVREDNIIWTYSNDKNAVLTISGAGAVKDYVGKNYAGNTYTPPWAKYAGNVKKIVIEDTVTAVGTTAFKGFTALTDVEIQTVKEEAGAETTAIKSVGNNAFSGCTSLTAITLPEGVNNIYESAFEGCSKLASAPLPTTLEYIEKNAFKSTALESVTVPEGITAIPEGTFAECTKLAKVTLPQSLTSIGASAFQNCTALPAVVIPDTVTVIGNSAFSGCAFLQTANIPASINTIGDSAFKGCGITSVVIPDTVTSIGASAFANCTAVKKVLLPIGAPNLAESVFSGCTGLEAVIVPKEQKSIGNNAFAGCTALELVYYLSSEFDWEALTKGDGNSALTGAKIYYNCERENGSIYRLDEDTATLEIVTGSEIGAYTEDNPAPWASEKVTSLILPSELNKIGDNAFAGCENIADVYYAGSKASWQNAAVSDMGNTALETASIYCDTNRERDILWAADSDTGVLTIGGCGDIANYSSEAPAPWSSESSVSSVEIKSDITSIGDYAFYGCSSVSAINIPENIASIGEQAFEGCYSLETLTADEGSEYFTAEGNVLYDKSKTTLIKYAERNSMRVYEIPDTVTTIASKAISSAPKLTAVIVPASVSTIAEEGLYNCASLTDVYYIGEESAWNEITKSSSNTVLSNAEIHIAETAPAASGEIKTTELTVADAFANQYSSAYVENDGKYITLTMDVTDDSKLYAKAYIAHKNADGVVTSVEFTDGTYDADTKQLLFFAETESDTDNVEIFVWNGIGAMTPVTNKYSS